MRATVTRVLNIATRPARARSFERLVAGAPGDELKINIGAGPSRLPGWVNTDVHWRSAAYLDLTRPWPQSVLGRVQWVYADNVVEHFPLVKFRQVLGHLRDAMTPGGRLRLVTPDVEAVARAYLEHSELGDSHLERHRRAGYEVHHRVDLLRIVFCESEHYLGYLYDYDSLRSELSRAGFVRIVRRESGQSESSEFRGLEQRSGETDRLTTLVVEADRP